jgi:hypothetical protein
MATVDLETVTDFALMKIDQARIVEEPFPHVIIDQLFPDTFFRELRENFPDRSKLQEVTYPGTGHGKKTSRYRESGLAWKGMKSDPAFSVVHELFASEAFSRALLNKFSRRLPSGVVPIPVEKHSFFKSGAADFASVFDFQIDLPGYEIPPHPDVWAKIVTYQYFLVDDESLRDYGTLFCKAKNGRGVVRRPFLTRAAGRLVNEGAKVFRATKSEPFRRLEQSPLGLSLGVGTTRNWLPWKLLDVVKIAEALPNHFMAFAPNAVSYHAVRMDIPADCARQDRPVIRGFIRTGRENKNWIRAVKM